MSKTLRFSSILLILVSIVLPCTSAVISGKATKDGRPLLWKHRDTGAYENKLVFAKGSQYNYVGVANYRDTTNQQIWMGANSAGFAIMNTASYNLNTGQVCEVPDDQEGLFMRVALETCATLKDFEVFMDTSHGKWGLEANFGVIDAEGGAAYYEKGYYSVTKYDATDPEVAPDGYLIRTNFSVAGTEADGYGYIRYDATAKLFQQQPNLSVEFILESATRNFKHGLLGTDLRQQPLPADRDDEKFVLLRDYVVRESSASTMIVQGVLSNEDPALTTIWTLLGWQPVTLVTPVWVRSAALLPEIVKSVNGAPAPLNVATLKLKDQCFPIEQGNGQDYMLLSMLTTQADDGILDQVLPAEKTIISEAMALQERWRKKRIRERDLVKFNTWLDSYVRRFYSEELETDL